MIYCPSGYQILQVALQPSVVLKWSCAYTKDETEFSRILSACTLMCASFPALAVDTMSHFMVFLKEAVAVNKAVAKPIAVATEGQASGNNTDQVAASPLEGTANAASDGS